MSKSASSGKIVFIGAGRVARALAIALKSKRKIVQVYSPHNAKQLAGKLKCAHTHDIKKIDTDADIYIVAVKDDAIAKVASALKLKGKTILHTSGTVNMEVLKKASANYGVLYPVHSFTGDKPLSKHIPFCIEATNTKIKKQIAALVKDLSGKAYYMDSAQRAKLHLAAVFANNFANHIYTLADNIASSSHIPFDILLHLIEETVHNLKHSKPKQNQTGPAIRNDKGTMARHEQMLKNDPMYLSLYKLISKSIQQS